MKVSNMESLRGNTVPNQFIITDSENMVEYFQSYNSIIVKTVFENGKRQVILDESKWDYSATTSKYRNRFLGEDTQTTKAKIKSGEYKLADLNK